jgi:hypothetical protein
MFLDIVGSKTFGLSGVAMFRGALVCVCGVRGVRVACVGIVVLRRYHGSVAFRTELRATKHRDNFFGVIITTCVLHSDRFKKIVTAIADRCVALALLLLFVVVVVSESIVRSLMLSAR